MGKLNSNKNIIRMYRQVKKGAHLYLRELGFVLPWIHVQDNLT